MIARYHCTPEQPWSPAIKAQAVTHSDVREVGEQEDGWPAGDIVTYECGNCGHRWRSELPP